MDKILIEGARPLKGEVSISGAKNAALPVLAATLLSSGENHIGQLPQVQDVLTMIHLIEDLGAYVTDRQKNHVVLDTKWVKHFEARYDLVSTMRASCLVLGPLLARMGEARVSLPGGCAIGARPVDQHIQGLKALGAEIEVQRGYIQGKAKKLIGAKFSFDTVTVTGTMNVMMAAVLAQGTSVLRNTAKEPEVGFLAEVLNQAGAKIAGVGTDTLTIEGVDTIKPLHCEIFPDRVEAATYMIAGAITQGEVKITNCHPSHVEPVTLKLREAGANVKIEKDSILVSHQGPLQSVDIKTEPYPGFATDCQAQFMALMALATGKSQITESVFENRFMHAAELSRLGADIHIDGHTATVCGVQKLSGAEVMATDLRASASLVLAGLAAKGETLISRVYHIDRGYESMEKKFSKLGASIKRVR